MERSFTAQPIGRGGCQISRAAQIRSCPNVAAYTRRTSGGYLIDLCEKHDRSFGTVIGEAVEFTKRGGVIAR